MPKDVGPAESSQQAPAFVRARAAGPRPAVRGADLRAIREEMVPISCSFGRRKVPGGAAGLQNQSGDRKGPRRVRLPPFSAILRLQAILRFQPRRSSRAAAAIAPTFADAISRVFIGRFEKVPKPQSGFRKIALGRDRDAAPLRRPHESARGDLHLVGARVDDAEPELLAVERHRGAPARSVAYSSTSCVTSQALEIGRQRLIAAAQQRRLVAAPVAAADVHADPHAVDARRPRG